VVEVELLFEVAAELMEARADVAFQLTPAQYLSRRAGCLASPQFELE
jgi:hypothetical protein